MTFLSHIPQMNYFRIIYISELYPSEYEHDSNVNSVYREGLIYAVMPGSSFLGSENENSRKTLRPECQSEKHKECQTAACMTDQ